MKTLVEAKPTLFFGVPRVYEKIQEKMMEVAKTNTGSVEGVEKPYRNHIKTPHPLPPKNELEYFFIFCHRVKSSLLSLELSFRSLLQGRQTSK